MNSDQISQLAAKQEMPADGMTCTDWLLWYMLRDIYRDFKAGRLDAEKGAERKKHSLSIWEKETFRARQLNELADSAGKLWKRIEMYADTYRLNRTLQNADRLIEAIYGVPVSGEHDGYCNNESVSTEQNDQNGGDGQ